MFTSSLFVILPAPRLAVVSRSDYQHASTDRMQNFGQGEAPVGQSSLTSSVAVE